MDMTLLTAIHQYGECEDEAREGLVDFFLDNVTGDDAKQYLAHIASLYVSGCSDEIGDYLQNFIDANAEKAMTFK